MEFYAKNLQKLNNNFILFHIVSSIFSFILSTVNYKESSNSDGQQFYQYQQNKQ